MTTMAPVMRDSDCVGFLLRRFNTIEAYDREAYSLGLFESDAEAAKAVLEASIAPQLRDGKSVVNDRFAERERSTG
jgi:hypothetical protein